MTAPKSKAAPVGFAGVGAAAVLALAYLLGGGFEGSVKTTYWDNLGKVWTVCGGVTGPGVIPGKTYTDAECAALETGYLTRMYARMGQCVAGEFPPEVVKAFGHFAYNVGPEAFCRSTAAKKLRAGDIAGACRQIANWTYIGKKNCRDRANKCYGIVLRREWEQKTCEAGL